MEIDKYILVIFDYSMLSPLLDCDHVSVVSFCSLTFDYRVYLWF